MITTKWSKAELHRKRADSRKVKKKKKEEKGMLMCKMRREPSGNWRAGRTV